MRQGTLYHLTELWSQNFLTLSALCTPRSPLLSTDILLRCLLCLYFLHGKPSVLSLCSQVHWNSMIFLLHERKGSLFHFPWLFPSQHTALNYQQRKNAGFHKCTWERTPSARIRGNQIALELYEWTDVWNYGMAQHMNLNYNMHTSICCVSWCAF